LADADLTIFRQAEIAVGLVLEQSLGSGAGADIGTNLGSGTIVQAVGRDSIKARIKAQVTVKVDRVGLRAVARTVERGPFDSSVPGDLAI
jgi:hypothetical protein